MTEFCPQCGAYWECDCGDPEDRLARRMDQEFAALFEDGLPRVGTTGTVLTAEHIRQMKEHLERGK